MEQDHGLQNDELRTVSRRLLRLEERMDRMERIDVSMPPMTHPAWPLALAAAAALFGFLGMGVPSHPYQYLFAGLVLLLAYHRGFLCMAGPRWQWPLAAVNYLNLLLVFLIMLGGGVRRPLAWLKSPAVEKGTPPHEGAWYRSLVPDYSIQWHSVPGLSDWSIDLTKIQVFLLVATLAGVLFRFQGFASVTALALLVISIPAYLSFSWDWVVLFLVLASVSLYLQTAPPAPVGSGRRP